MGISHLIGNNIYIRPLKLSDADAMLKLRLRNRGFLAPFEPVQADTHFTLQVQQELIEQGIADQLADQSYTFGIFRRHDDELAGRIRLSAVFRGPWQNANLGYYIDQANNGKGYMTEAVRLILQVAFEQVNLHRVQAAVMTWNEASIRVLQKAGFRHEGVAKHYLLINGKWEDHNLYAMTREDWEGRRS